MPSSSTAVTLLVFHQFCNVYTGTSLVPRPPPFFVLRFAFNIIHGSGIIRNANQRTKKPGKAWERGYTGTWVATLYTSYLASLGLHLNLLPGDNIDEEVKHVVLCDCYGNVTPLQDVTQKG